jgi:hypothetical protein
MVRDVLSRSKTAAQLYTTDLRVLVDVLLRHIADAERGSHAQTEYVALLHALVRNSEYGSLKVRFSPSALRLGVLTPPRTASRR